MKLVWWGGSLWVKLIHASDSAPQDESELNEALAASLVLLSATLPNVKRYIQQLYDLEPHKRTADDAAPECARHSNVGLGLC